MWERSDLELWLSRMWAALARLSVDRCPLVVGTIQQPQQGLTPWGTSGLEKNRS